VPVLRPAWDARLKTKLLDWFDANKRPMPWRANPTPYRVWISEVMLQQTQVAAAIPYFERFARRFPDERALAGAKEPEVLRLWAGLGYYSRARNLLAAAKEIRSKHAGRLPSDHRALLKLPGFGPYTAAAVASIAFGLPEPLVDGNAARVLARLFAVEGEVKPSKNQRLLWGLAGAILPKERPGDWNQALMELGAVVCVPESPRCGVCPFREACLARLRGAQSRIPRPGKKERPVRVRIKALLIEDGGRVLLWRRSKDERLLPGHWGLPEARHLPELRHGPPVGSTAHAITRHRIRLTLHEAPRPPEIPPNCEWLPLREAGEAVVSSLWAKALRIRRDRCKI
jgi:A/G-specific adenine glycosylase